MKKIIVFMILLGFAAVPANADLINPSSGVSYSNSIVASLADGDQESNTYIYAYDEQQNVPLTSNLYVDIVNYGTYSEVADLETDAYIPAGTFVNSYIIHADPVGTTTKVIWDEEISFTNKILGVIVTYDNLINSDSMPGVSSTTYSSDSLRGLEFYPFNDDYQDNVEITVSFDKLIMHLETTNKIDNIRVIELVPVPATILLGFIGLGIGGWKLRKSL